MKKIIVLVSFAFLLAGCSNAPVAMKSTKKYFAPVKTFAQKPTQNKSKFASSIRIEKELSEKNTMIELLTKENEQLRTRLAKLEKKLSIIQS
jgi:starvation-inducible outer membrane lipoprotein